jgi:hypothetical protein
LHGGPSKSPVPSTCRGPEVIGAATTFVLTNPFPHGKNMTQASLSTDGGSQGPPASSSNPSFANIYMMKGDAYIVTRAHDYGMSKSTEKGKEATNPLVPLHIERIDGRNNDTHPERGVQEIFS